MYPMRNLGAILLSSAILLICIYWTLTYFLRRSGIAIRRRPPERKGEAAED